MTFPQFNKALGILTLASVVISLILSQFELFKDTLGFSITSILLFAAMTMLLFFMGLKTVHSPNKNLFQLVAMGSIFVKVILIMAILFSYRTLYGQESKSHLFIFLSLYIAYTIFETAALMKLSKMKE